MALPRARSLHVLLSGLIGASCLLTGCPEAERRNVTPSAISQLPEVELNTQRINGLIVGPAALGNGTRIPGSEDNDGAFGEVDLGIPGDGDATGEADATDEADATGEADASSGSFRVLQTTPAELPVENATVSVKSYDWKAVNQLVTKRSDEDGQFFFNYVPAKVAFFLEGVYTVGDKKYYMLGLTRTGDIGETTEVKIDVPSTLVSRLLLRIWHISNRFVDFKELSPKDFNPLLLNLRKELSGGLPSGVTLDLSKVSQPVGEFKYDEQGQPNDKSDSALKCLDQLAARYEMIDRDVDRLYKAMNKIFAGVEDGPLKRPPAIR